MAHEDVVHHPGLSVHLHESYGARELDALARFLDEHGTLAIESLPNGLYRALGRATERGQHTGYHNTWLRDTVHVAECLRRSGGPPAHAERTARTLLAWLSREEPRFTACIRGEADIDDAMQRPHIRFRGDTLEELPEEWPHKQNDALGVTLWYCARLASEGVLTLSARELDALVRLARYFDAIAYEHDRDSGHWEEIEKVAASSVGAVIAGLRELERLALVEPDLRGETAWLSRLRGRGERELCALLPAESRGEADPRANRPVDAALLFLIEPLHVVTGDLAEQILANVRASLEGPHGIRRYVGDSYWMADYPALTRDDERSAAGETALDRRDALFIPGGEAQWCLFDPLVAIIHARRAHDPRHRTLAARHVRRALAQITGPECPRGEGACPEAYYRTARDPDAPYEANENTPLAWTQAMLRLSLHELREMHK